MLFKVLKIAENWLQSIKWINVIPGIEILRDQDNTLKHIVVKWPKQMETFRFANRISHTALVHWFGLWNVVEWFQNHNRNSVTTTKTLIFSCTTILKLANRNPTVYNWTRNSYDVWITKTLLFYTELAPDKSVEKWGQGKYLLKVIPFGIPVFFFVKFPIQHKMCVKCLRLRITSVILAFALILFHRHQRFLSVQKNPSLTERASEQNKKKITANCQWTKCEKNIPRNTKEVVESNKQ